MSDRDDEIMQEVERQSRAATQRVREMCFERGRDDLVAEIDAAAAGGAPDPASQARH